MGVCICIDQDRLSCQAIVDEYLEVLEHCFMDPSIVFRDDQEVIPSSGLSKS